VCLGSYKGETRYVASQPHPTGSDYNTTQSRIKKELDGLLPLC